MRLAEEQLVVGKRLVQEGTARIRRFATERPVEQQVTLHEEHAQLMHLAVSDPKFSKSRSNMRQRRSRRKSSGRRADRRSISSRGGGAFVAEGAAAPAFLCAPCSSPN